MKVLAWLRGKSADTDRSALNPGEPLLFCYGCERTKTFGQLTLFPWWDERVNAFDVVYRCDRCLPKERKKVLKQLMKHEERLTSFVDFASQRVASRQLVAPHARQGAEALDYARRVLDALVAHEALVQNP
jgi:hypothetical protein